jgi:CRISPR system Cascade subunit CasD
MDYLLFRLYGAMASWGSIAVGQERPSDAYPAKSAILGLIGAAMGVRRNEEEQHQHMAAAYRFAVRVDAPGVLLRDYHTIQVPPERRKVVHYTRRDELGADSLNTILSGREYRCDALYTIALWVRDGQSAQFALGDLVQGLKQPRFPLYLGRKSCPLALPVQAEVIAANTLGEAFRQVKFKDDADLLEAEGEGQLPNRPDRVLTYWEADDHGTEIGDWQPMQTITRRDQLLSRQRWQFTERREHQARIERQER